MAVALIVIVVAIIPYALAYSLARPGIEFTGVLMNPEDSNSYLAKMQEGYGGEWLYTIPYTAEEHTPAFLGGFYLLLGHLARVSSLSVIQMWHVARVVSGLVLFLVTFGFVRAFTYETGTRWTAYLIAVAGSGLGWLFFLLGQNYWLGDFPVDFKMPESHLFFTALTFPHFAIGTTLILASVWLSHRAFETGRLSFAAGAGVVNLALAIVYPFLIYLCAAILALWWVHRAAITRHLPVRAGIQMGIALAIPVPLLLYYFWVLKTNPVFGAWDAQAATPSPNLLHFLLAYGPMLVLAAPTLRRPEFRALWLWVLAAALLVYLPLNPQRRFVEGVQVPLAILAASGLFSYFLPRLRVTEWFRRLAARPNYSVAGLERFVVVFLLLFFALSNIYVLASASLTAALEQSDLFFRSTAEVNAVEWAGANLPRGAVVLAQYETGNFIPTRTNLRTVVGHWAETPDYEQINASVQKFFDGATTDEWRRVFLIAQHVDYIFYGPRERSLGSYDLAEKSGLRDVYEHAGVYVFQVMR